jgi:hypothetical protein
MAREGATRLLGLLRAHYPSAIEAGPEAVSVTKAGDGRVMVKLTADLPPEHLDHITPDGYATSSPGIHKTGSDSYVTYTVRPKKALVKWALAKLLMLFVAAVFTASLVYLYVHWGAPVDRTVREYAKLSGVSHELLTYTAAAVVLIAACAAAFWILCSSREHEKSH